MPIAATSAIQSVGAWLSPKSFLEEPTDGKYGPPISPLGTFANHKDVVQVVRLWTLDFAPIGTAIDYYPG